MKRTDITQLFPEAPKETIDKLMDLNGADVNAAKAEVENLKAQAELQQYIADFREQQIRDTLASNSDLSQYATYNFADQTIEINWDAINSVTDADLGQRIEDFITKNNFKSLTSNITLFKI